MAITKVIDPFPPAPKRIVDSQEDFDTKADNFLARLETLDDDLNEWKDQCNQTQQEINTAHDETLNYRNEAENFRNNAHDWAQAEEDVEVNDGEHPIGKSAYNWAKKSHKWANEAEDTEVNDGEHTGYSARHWSRKSYLWANANENQELNIDGKTGYSAYHWAQKTARGDLFTATSNTEHTIENNTTKVFTLNEPNRGFIIGSKVRISDYNNPTNYYMEGIVTAYNDNELTVAITIINGDGHSSNTWAISLSGTSIITETFKFLEYDDRGTLRNIENNFYYYVKELGVYKWFVGLDEPDDDELCFKTTNGAWLLILPDFETTISYIHGVTDGRFQDIEANIESLQTDVNKLKNATYLLEVDNTIASVSANSTANQTITDSKISENDLIFVSYDSDPGSLVIRAVSSDGSCTILVSNITGNNITLNNTKWRLLIVKH